MMQPPTLPYATMQPVVMMPQLMVPPNTYSYDPSAPNSNMNQFQQYMQEKQEEYVRRVEKNAK